MTFNLGNVCHLSCNCTYCEVIMATLQLFPYLMTCIFQTNTQRVEPTEHPHLVLSRHLLYPGDLPALPVPAPGRPHVDHGVVLQLVRAIEYTAAVVGAHHRELAVLTREKKGYTCTTICDASWIHYFYTPSPPPTSPWTGTGRRKLLFLKTWFSFQKSC